MLTPDGVGEAALALLCYSSEHCGFLALKLTPDLFVTNRINQRILEAAVNFINKYHTPPGHQLDLILENEISRGEEGKLLRSTILFLEQQSQKLEVAFVLEELNTFIKTRKFQTACRNALELAEAGNLEKAQQDFFKDSFQPVEGSPGILLQDPSQSLSFFDSNDRNEFFSSAIEALDRKGVRPDRKTLSFLIAAAKKGKSWWLVDVGKAGIQHHHQVLHITLEISEEKTARRYIQSIFSLTKDQAQQLRVPYFVHDASGVTSIQFNEFERASLFDKRADLQKRLVQMKSYPPLIIKEFPTGSLSTEQLYMYLDTLDREKGFRPDLIVIDYADLMRLDSKELRIDTGRLYKDLRGLAVTKNLAVVTATQGNRESASAKLVNDQNVAEDWSKIGTADVVLTYSQTAQEKILGLARIFVSNARDAEDKFIALVSQAYPIGQFAISSVLMNSQLVNQIEGSGNVH